MFLINFIKICGMPIKEEIETKFIGVTIDDELMTYMVKPY